ncbi:MAG: sulfurtransferase complex subunit TusD [Pseudomonadota bacterium]
MKYTILVNEGPYQHQASDSALQFVRAALAQGHEIVRVFFYHDGVHNGTRLSAPPQDERHLQKAWSDLALQYHLDLVICIVAAQRRGIMDDDEAQRRGLNAHNLVSGFRIAGLGQLVDGCIVADRFLVFGD